MVKKAIRETKEIEARIILPPDRIEELKNTLFLQYLNEALVADVDITQLVALAVLRSIQDGIPVRLKSVSELKGDA